MWTWQGDTGLHYVSSNSVLYNKNNGLRGSYDNHCVFATLISSKLSILDADLPICNLVELNTGGGCVGNCCRCFYLSVESFWNVILDSFSLFLCSFVFHFFTRDRKQGPGDMHMSQARRTIQPVYYDLFVVFGVFVPLNSNNALIFMIMLLHILNMKLGIWTHFVKSTGK